MPTLMQRALVRSVRGTVPETQERMRALANVRWVFATDDGGFVTVDDRARASLTRDASRAIVYDGRDNEELKCRFMEALLGVSLTVVLLDE